LLASSSAWMLTYQSATWWAKNAFPFCYCVI